MDNSPEEKPCLIELEDYAWFPAFLRDFQTDFIGYVVKRFGFYNEFISYLNSLQLQALPACDLCSGSGEPAITIYKRVAAFSSLTLSDKYPSKKATNNIYTAKSNDVVQMTFQAGRYYTMFNAFHHFSDPDKLAISDRITKSGATAFFVEILQPRAKHLIGVFFLAIAGNLVLTPFIKPFSLQRLFFTYLFPVNLFTILWDGWISVFRSRSVAAYQNLFDQRKNVEIFELKRNWISLVVIQITPYENS